jgi:DNA-binding MarR family transcriptional regulator
MDGVLLLRLAKRLAELGREVVAEAGATALTPGEVAVVADVFRHPGSSVRAVGARTGFAQSHVSGSVARLRERGLVSVDADPADRRRTRISLTDRALEAVHRRAEHSADGVLARALPDPAQAERAGRLLAELATLLLPPGPADTAPPPGRRPRGGDDDPPRHRQGR